MLRFLADTAIPPTSNQADRDLRPAKTQQKISGRLRSEKTTRDRYAIRGYASTAAKHGHQIFTTIRDALARNPWIPLVPAPNELRQGPVAQRYTSVTRAPACLHRVLPQCWSDRWKVGEPACRPGSVRPLTRGGDHPSGTAVADSLVRSTREHRAGRPQTLAQGTAVPLLTLLRVGFTEPPQSPAALVVSYTAVSPLPPRGRGGGLFSVALSRGSPRVGVTDHPALWSPDLPRRACARRDRPADSPRVRIR